MFIPLVDILRCPVAHEDTWLVAAIDRAAGRDIVEGTLGCPRCHAEYAIHAGVVLFAPDVERPAYRAPGEAEAIRLAAALDLTDPYRTAVLQGEWGVNAPIIAGMSPAQLLLVNAPDGIASGDGISLLRAAAAPLARGSVGAAAFDANATPEMIASLVASLRVGARMAGPVTREVPAGLMELARDGEVWVAELSSSSAGTPVKISRRPSV